MASIYDVIADPTRRAILELLAASERSVGELETELGLPQPYVSKHLQVLRAAGVVDSRPEAQRRLYRLKPAPLQQLDAWLSPFRRIWSSHVDALERHLDAMSATAAEDRAGGQRRKRKVMRNKRGTAR